MTMNTPAANRQPSHTAADGYFYFGAITLLILLASILRIHGIDRQSLWSDELFAVMASYKPAFSDIWGLLANDSHPPGYVALMYYLIPWLGYSDIGIRLPSFIYGILWIPLVYWIGRRWISREAGLLAAALMVCSHSAIYFSQEARAYSMLITFCLGNIICFLEILFSSRLHRAYVHGFVISSILILYLHYTGFVFFAAEGLLYMIFWASSVRRGTWREVLICFGIPLLLYAPWLGLMIHHLTDTSLNWAVSAKPSLDDVYYSFQRLWGPDDRLTKLYLCALVLALLLAFYQHARRIHRRQTVVVYTLVFLLVVPVLAFYVESQIWTPIFEKRYFLVTLPLAALLLGFLYSKALLYWVSTPWQRICLVLTIMLMSVWMINSNIDKQLYTEKSKDPVREAVDVIKRDLGEHAAADNYSVIMTFGWFEHYLRQLHVSYDKSWENRIYYAPQQIGNVTGYLEHRPAIQYLYYLSLRDPNSDAATNALKMRYKLVSNVSLVVPSGAIDIYKFNTQQAPDAGVINGEKDKFNDVAEFIVNDAGKRAPNTYTTLITHDWMQPHLVYHKVSLDTSSGEHFYYRDTQLDQVVTYLAAHPDITTLYYVWLQDPALAAAADLLQVKYPLLSHQEMETPAGKINIDKLNTRGKAGTSKALQSRMEKLPSYQAATALANTLGGKEPARYQILSSRYFLEAYLQASGLAVNDKWPERHYYIDQQAESVFAYLERQPRITDVYYVFLDEPQAARAAYLLATRFNLLAETRVDSGHGIIRTFHFDSKNKPANLAAVSNELKGNPVFHLAKWMGRDAQKNAGKAYMTLISHDFFQPYLELHQVNVDRTWNDRFVSHPNQAATAIDRLKAQPELHFAYYLAIMDKDSRTSVDLIRRSAHVECQKTIKSPNLGEITLVKFDLKSSPTPSAAIKLCAD